VETDFIDAVNEFKKPSDIGSVIGEYGYLLASTSSMSFKEDADFFNYLKGRNPRLRTIVFGSHPTFLPDDTLRNEGVDIIIKGEPEYAAAKIITGILKRDEGWKGLKGVGFKHNKNMIKVNAGNEFLDNLDDLPFVDSAFLSKRLGYFNPIVKRMPYMTMVTSRGCPGKCIFCTAPFFYGTRIRLQSPGRVIDEIKYLIGNGFKEIYFRDETFTADYKRTADICERLISDRTDVSWICNARSGTIDEPLAKIMKRAGCHTVKIGVESGVQAILDKANKGITVEKTRDTIEYLKSAGINVHAHVMLGMPGENAGTIKRTIEFVRNLDPYTASFGICTPYPGTPLFNIVKKEMSERGMGPCPSNELDLQHLHSSAFYNEIFTELSSEELEKAVKTAYRRFYVRPASLKKYLKDIFSIGKNVKAGIKVIDFMIRGDE